MGAKLSCPGLPMNRICRLENKIQNYAWGSCTAIPELLGIEPDANIPCAELWMGAHPKAPSMVLLGDRKASLLDLVKEDPIAILGRKAARQFDGQLPYLFKVLAAEKPLSLQAHPDSRQAAEGFKREIQQGVSMDAFDRNYKDEQHKPECICALTRFWGINGFRKISEIQALLDRIHLPELAPRLEQLRKSPGPAGLKQFFHGMMTLSRDRKASAVERLLAGLDGTGWDGSIKKWIQILAEEYPGDIGIFSPLIMHLVCLEPGQAMFLEAGDLHAYLKGVGIEIMANSDNVLRGGLTPKHVDVQELMKVLNFREKSIQILDPVPDHQGERIYPTPAAEFVLSAISLNNTSIYTSPLDRSVEIMLCTTGRARIRDLVQGRDIRINQGDVLLIPASVGQYELKGHAELFKAGVPGA